MRTSELFYRLVVTLFVIAYITNIVKLLLCDFASPYKEEFIHALGIFIPPASFVTVFF